MKRDLPLKKLAILIILPLIISTSTTSITHLTKADSEIIYYAKTIKYPTPNVPEPVLNDGIFNITVELSSTTTWSNATVYNETHQITATLINARYDDENKVWQLSFDLPKGFSEGAYGINLAYNGGTIQQPRCLWIMPQWPKTLKILAGGDVKPEGLPYYWEMMKEANLINPDVILNLGDLVNVPTTATEWKRFLEPHMQFKDPMYVIPGNHEYSGVGKSQIYEDIIGPINWTATVGNFLFVGCLLYTSPSPRDS